MGTTFGSGDGSTTFNVPDLRGRGVFGQDNMGGSAASRITVAGGNFDGTVLGGAGGTQNHTLTTAEMPVHNHSVTDPGHAHTYNTPNYDHPTSLTSGFNAPAGNTGSFTGSATTGISIQNAGSGAAHAIMNPAMTLPYILRVI